MLTWKEVSLNEWSAPINNDSYFEIILTGETYNLRVVAPILENNMFAVSFDTLEAAKEKASDLFTIFNEFIAGSTIEDEDSES